MNQFATVAVDLMGTTNSVHPRPKPLTQPIILNHGEPRYPPRKRTHPATWMIIIATILSIIALITMIIFLTVPPPGNKKYHPAYCSILSTDWVYKNDKFNGVVASTVLAIKDVNYVPDNTTYVSNEICDEFDVKLCMTNGTKTKCEVYYTSSIQKVSINGFVKPKYIGWLMDLTIVLGAVSMMIFMFSFLLNSCFN